MLNQKRIRDYGVVIGQMPTGPLNAITDCLGVTVGHYTINSADSKTGVTAILPHQGNVFKEKLVAAQHVKNAFGKSCGLMQIEELGQLETPILLTNTLNVGLVTDALVEYMCDQNEDIGKTTGSVNPVVCECNDQYLNDIRIRSVKKQDVFEAIRNAKSEFLEGDVGAGKGMRCFGYKGGIGSSSRVILVDKKQYTVGVLVLSNFGKKGDLLINNEKLEFDYKEQEIEKGSIIFLVATDAPLCSRQLKRVIKRVEIGLIRTGSYLGNGSGDVVVGFSTANIINHEEERVVVPFEVWNENKIDCLFRATAEASEEAILNSLVTCETVKGRDGHEALSLKYLIK